MKEEIFVRLDADNIGDAIELSLISNDIDTAKLIHNNIQVGIMHIEKQLKDDENCNILLRGCDDILFKMPCEFYSEDLLVKLKSEFFGITGHTLSIGVSDTLEKVLINLRKAKLSGKDIIITDRS